MNLDKVQLNMNINYFCMSALFLSLAAAVTLASSLPNGRTVCAPKTCPETKRFQFKIGKSYEYDYGGEVTSSIHGTNSITSGVHIAAKIIWRLIGPCQMAMLLKDCHLRQSDSAVESTEMRQKLERSWLLFSIQDGVVEKVCPSIEDPTWVTNVKRGILSALQISDMDLIRSRPFSERDVHGDCPTRYEIVNGWTTLEMKKIKDLGSCKNNVNFVSAVRGVPYFGNSNLKHDRVDPFLNSSLQCNYNISDGLIQNINCTEVHIIKQFSNKENGAKTMATQKLKLTSVTESKLPIIPAMKTTASNLLFDHDYKRAINEDDHGHFKQAKTAIMQFCNHTENGVHLFWSLVSAVKQLSLQKLKQLQASINEICTIKHRGWQYLRDALPMAATAPALQMLTELTVQGAFTENEINGWPIALGLAANPTDEAITALMPLLDMDNLFTRLSLTISSMINTLCRRNNATDCLSFPSATAFVHKMANFATEHCSRNVPDKYEEQVIVALKALANVGHVTEYHMKSIITDCANNVRNTYEVRVAAIQLFRRMSCTISRSNLWRTFSSAGEDSELRIAAYLQLMACPTTQTIQMIRQVLQMNDSVQVGGFVMSHMSNLQESLDPCKLAIKEFLSDEILTDKYPLDVRKYSRYLEKSIYSETLDMGGVLEGNIVYSSSSFVPRSFMFNVTADIFGNSYNLFEFNARLEGFDHLLESIFRPEDIQTSVNNRRVTARQSPFQKLQAITQLALSERKKSSPPRASSSMKLFGSELWHSSKDANAINSAIYWWSELSLADLLEKLAEDRQVDTSRAFVIIDSTMTMPTLLGFPMILSLNSTLNLHMKINGRFDIRHLHRGNCEMKGIIRPSASLAMSSALTVDSYVGRSGIALDVTANMLMTADGNMQLQNGRRLSARLYVPDDVVNMADIRSSVMLLNGAKKVPLAGITQGRVVASWCLSSVKALGLEPCVAIAYANASALQDQAPYFPLTGPASITVFFNKTDPSLTVYRLEHAFQAFPDERLSSWKIPRSFLFKFDTPRSVIDREWTIDYAFNDRNNSILLKILTPYKKLAVLGAYNHEPTWQSLRANFIVDGTESLDISADVRIQQSQRATQYSPKLMVAATHGTKLVQIEGHVHVQPGHRLAFNLTVENLTTKPITLGCSIVKNDTANSIIYDTLFHSPALHFNVGGYISMSSSSLASETSAVYQFAGMKKETVDVTAKFRYLLPSGGSLTKLSVTADVSLSVLPSLSTVVTWEFARAKGHLENIFSLQRHDQDPEIFIQQMLTYEGTLDDHQINGQLHLRLPRKDVNASIVLNHKSTLLLLRSKLDFWPTAKNLYAIEAEVQNSNGTQLAIAGRLALTLANKRSQVSGLIREEKPSHYKCRFVREDSFNVQRIAIVEYWSAYTDTWANHSLQIDAPSWPLQSTVLLSAFEHGGLLQAETLVSGFRYSNEINYITPPKTPGIHKFHVVYRKPSVTYRGRITIRNVRDKILEVALHRRPGTSPVETTRSGTVNQSIFAFARLKYNKEIRELAADIEWNPTNKFNLTIGQVNRPNLKSTYANGDYMDGEASFQVEHTRSGSMDSGTFAYQVRGIVDWAKASKKASLAMVLSSSDFGEDGEFRIVKGSLEAATPINGLEYLGMTVERNRSKSRWNNSASMWWAKSSHVRVTASGRSWSELNYDGNEALIQLETPFHGLESAFVNWSRARTGAESKAMTFVSWSPKDIIKASASLVRPSLNRSLYSANLDLHTPFSVLQHASASAYGLFNSQEFDAKLAASCNCNQILSMSTRLSGAILKLGKKGRRLNATFEAVVVIHEEVSVSIVLFHEKDDIGRFDNEVRVSFPDRRKALIRINGNKLNNNHVIAALTALFKLPSQEIILNGTFTKIDYSWKAMAALNRNNIEDEDVRKTNSDEEEVGKTDDEEDEVGKTNDEEDEVRKTNSEEDEEVAKWWQDFRKGEVLLTSTILSAGNFSINTVIKVMDTKHWWPETSLSVSNTWNGSRLLSKFNVQHDDKQSGLDILWSTGKGSLDALILVTTPLEDFPRASMAVTHYSTSNMVYNTWATCDWGGHGYTISGNHTLTYMDRLNFHTSLDIIRPFENGLKIDVAQSWKRGQLQNSLKVQKETLDVVNSEINANIAASVTSKAVSAKWTLSIPNWLDGSSEVAFKYENDGKNLSPTITICRHLPGSYCARAVAHIRRADDAGTAVAYLLLETPTETWSNISVWSSYFAPGIELGVQAGAKWSPKAQLSVDAGIRFDTIAPLARIHLVTPFPGFSAFKLQGGFDAAATTTTISGFVEKDGWQASISGHGRFNHDSAGVQLQLETPEDHIGDISVDGSFKWTGGSRDSKYAIIQMTWSHDLQVECKASLSRPEPGRSVLMLTILTPLERLRRINTSIDALVKDDASSVRYCLSWYPEHTVNAFIAVSRNNSVPLNIQATLEPTNSSLRILIARNESYTSVNLGITHENRQMITEAQALTTSSFSQVTANLRNTLIPDINISEISAKVYVDKNYKVNATITSKQHSTMLTGFFQPGKTLSLEALRLPSRTHVGNILVKFDNRKGVDLIITSHVSSAGLAQTTWRGFWLTHGAGISTGTSLNIFGSEHKFALELQKELYEFVISSPKLGSGPWKSSYSAQRIGHSEVVKFRLVTPTEATMIHDVSLDLGISSNSITCEAHLDVPFLHLPFINWTSRVAKMSRGVEGSATLITATGDEYFASSKYTINDVHGGGGIHIEAHTPYEYADRIWLHVERRGRDWDNTEINADIKLPVPGYERTLVNAMTTHSNGLLMVNLHAQTPMTGYEKVDVLAKFSYAIDYSSLGPLLNISLPDSSLIISIFAEIKSNRKGGQVLVSWQPSSRNGTFLKPAVGEIRMICESLAASKQKAFGPCEGIISFSGGDWQGDLNVGLASLGNVTAKATAKTPFRECKSFSANVEHLMVLSMETSSINDSLRFDCDGKSRLDVNAAGLSKKGKAFANITLISTWAPMTRFSSTFNKVSSTNGQSVEAHLSLRGKRYIEGLAELSREMSMGGYSKDLRLLVDINSTWHSFRGSVGADRTPSAIATNASFGRGNDAIYVHAELAGAEVSDRRFALEFSHTRHKGRLEGAFQRKSQDRYTADATLLWGGGHADILKPVVVCNARRNSTQIVIEWQRPHHNLRVTLSKPPRKQKGESGRSETELELLWKKNDDEAKRLVVLLSHLNRSDDTGLDHIFAIEIIHPLLTRSWELESSICTQRKGHSLVMFNTSLKYSPNHKDDAFIVLNVNDIGQDEMRGWSVGGFAVHGPSDLNCSLEALAGIMYGQAHANANFSWHALDYSMRASFEKQPPKIFVEVYGPEFRSTLTGNMSRNTDGDIEVMAECKHNGMVLANLSSTVQVERRLAVANFTFTKDKLIDRFSTVIGWKDDKTFLAQMLHRKGIQASWPLHGIVHLNSSRLATGRFYWHTDLHEQIRDSLVENIRGVQSTVQSLVGYVSTCILDKARGIWSKLTDSAWDSLGPVRADVAEQIALMKTDWLLVMDTINYMTFFNDFYLKDILEALENVMQLAWDYTNLGWENITATAEAAYRWMLGIIGELSEGVVINIIEWLIYKPASITKTVLVTVMDVAVDNLLLLWDLASNWMQSIPLWFENIVARLSTIGKDIAFEFAQIPTPFSHLKAAAKNFIDACKEVAHKIQELATDVKHIVISSDLYISLRAGYHHVTEGLSQIIHYMQNMANNFRQFLLRQLSEPQRKLVDNIRRHLSEIWQCLVQISQPWSITNATSEAWSQAEQKVLWILDYYELRPFNIWTLFSLYSRIVSPFGDSLETSQERFNSLNKVTVDFDEGAAEMDQHLPFPWASLRSLPKLRDVPELAPLFRIWEALRTSDKHMASPASPYLVDWHRKINRVFDYTYWMPPFQAQALLVSWRHIVTFNGRTMELPETRCTYLLTSDVIDGNFSVAVNVDNDGQHSLVVLVDDRQVNMLPSDQVLLDHRKVELPVTFSQTVIKRQGTNLILHHSFGLEVSCCMKLAVCTVTISGWYFGKTIGLFGVYDNEPASEHTSNVRTAYHTWELTGNSRCSDGRSTQFINQRIVTQPREQTCWDNLVNLTSIMVNCYKTVDPKRFYEMCRTEQGDTCAAEAAYMQACHFHDVLLRLPRKCATCHLPTGQVIHEGETIVVNAQEKTNLKTADVVFIVEAKICNRNFPRVFGEFVHSLDSTLRSNRIHNNSYAIVVFGGYGVYESPQVHTWGSAIFGKARSAPSLSNFTAIHGNKDVFGALQFAIKLPFRPGAAKTFILIACSECATWDMQIGYPEMHRMILEDGITLHDIVYKDLSSKNPDIIYGFDGTLAYTSKDFRKSKLIGEEDLRRQAIVPKDICVPIALESNGTIFSGLRLLGSNKRDVKKSMDVFARRLAMTASQDVCQNCDCLPDDYFGMGQFNCQPCTFPRPAHIYGVEDSYLGGDYPSIYELETKYFGKAKNYAENLISNRRWNKR